MNGACSLPLPTSNSLLAQPTSNAIGCRGTKTQSLCPGMGYF